METQTRLSRHDKFISAENIVGIFSVSSDDSHIYIYIYIYASNLCRIVGILWREKSKRKFTETKHAICIITSNLAMFVTGL